MQYIFFVSTAIVCKQLYKSTEEVSVMIEL